jgi:hypothetical protein
MEREGFTKREAEALVGRTLRAVVDLSDVPKGTLGIVVATDHVGDFWLVGIQWRLIPGRGRRSRHGKAELRTHA